MAESNVQGDAEPADVTGERQGEADRPGEPDHPEGGVVLQPPPEEGKRPVPPSWYQENTPRKGRKQSSKAWKSDFGGAKRVSAEAEVPEGTTHICTLFPEDDKGNEICQTDNEGHKLLCGHYYQLNRGKAPAPGVPGPWITSHVLAHVKEAHPNSQLGKLLLAKDADDRAQKRLVMSASGDELEVLTKREKELRAQARWILYGKGCVRESVLDDPLFREMLRATDKSHALLTTHLAEEWQEAEFRSGHELICKTAREAHDATGIPAQHCGHDGSTIQKVKFQTMSQSWVPPDWTSGPHGGPPLACLALRPHPGSSDDDVIEFIEGIHRELFGIELTEVVVSMGADRAALGVSRKLGFAELPCGLHDADKPLGFCIGNLGRKTGKQFEPGRALTKKSRDCSSEFRHSTKKMDLLKKLSLEAGGPELFVVTDQLSKTRMGGTRRMFMREMRMKRGIDSFLSHHPRDWAKTPSEWTSLTEVEAIQQILVHFVVMVQHENLWWGGFFYVLRLWTLGRLRKTVFKVVDLPKVRRQTDDELPRFKKKIDTWTALGKETRQRALMEFEARFTGNTTATKTGVLKGGPPLLREEEGRKLVFDPRLTLFLHKFLTPETQADAESDAEECYIAVHRLMFPPDSSSQPDSQPTADPTPDPEPGDSSSDDEFCVSFVKKEVTTANTAEIEIRAEFREVIKRFRTFCGTVNWQSYEHKQHPIKDTKNPRLLEELLYCDIGPVMKHVDDNPLMGLIGKCGRTCVHQRPANSFNERCYSASAAAIGDDNATLHPRKTERRALSRINKDLIAHLRKGQKRKTPFKFDRAKKKQRL